MRAEDEAHAMWQITSVVRQQAEARAKRDILDQLKNPTLEMVNAGYDAVDGHLLTGVGIKTIFVAMIEEFEK